jgi:hypothetical protein
MELFEQACEGFRRRSSRVAVLGLRQRWANPPMTSGHSGVFVISQGFEPCEV